MVRILHVVQNAIGYDSLVRPTACGRLLGRFTKPFLAQRLETQHHHHQNNQGSCHFSQCSAFPARVAILIPKASLKSKSKPSLLWFGSFALAARLLAVSLFGCFAVLD